MNPETMNHPDLLTWGKPEPLNETKTWIESKDRLKCSQCHIYLPDNYTEKKCEYCLGIKSRIRHKSELCIECGKFKDKKSKSTKCTVCLFGMSHEEAVKHGFIQA